MAYTDNDGKDHENKKHRSNIKRTFKNILLIITIRELDSAFVLVIVPILTTTIVIIISITINMIRIHVITNNTIAAFRTIATAAQLQTSNRPRSSPELTQTVHEPPGVELGEDSAPYKHVRHPPEGEGRGAGAPLTRRENPAHLPKVQPDLGGGRRKVCLCVAVTDVTYTFIVGIAISLII